MFIDKFHLRFFFLMIIVGNYKIFFSRQLYFYYFHLYTCTLYTRIKKIGKMVNN